MTIVLIVLAGWVALCVPASIALLALGHAASAGDERPPLPAVQPGGSVVPLFGGRASICAGCAVLILDDEEHPRCPRCEGETVAAPRVGTRHVAGLA